MTTSIKLRQLNEMAQDKCCKLCDGTLHTTLRTTPSATQRTTPSLYDGFGTN